MIGYAYAVVDTAKSPAHLLVSQSLTFWGFVVMVMRWNNVVRGWNTPPFSTHSLTRTRSRSPTHTSTGSHALTLCTKALRAAMCSAHFALEPPA